MHVEAYMNQRKDAGSIPATSTNLRATKQRIKQQYYTAHNLINGGYYEGGEVV